MSRTPLKPYAGVLLWADLDGTLLNPERQLDPENLHALRQFHDGGGKFGVATGRSDHSLSLNFPELTLTLPGIFYNGALMKWAHEPDPVFFAHLPTEPVEVLDSLLDAFPGIGVEMLQGGRAWLARTSPVLAAQLAREGLHPVACAPADVPCGWFKVLLGGEPDMLRRAHAFLSARLPASFTLVFSEDNLLEILPAGVSKGRAIRRFLDGTAAEAHVPAPPPVLVTVGDNDNDADMLATADIGIAMGDASAAAKSAAGHVIGTNRTACLPQVLALLEPLRHKG